MITDEMRNAARAKGEEMGNGMPGAFVKAMGDIAVAGLEAALSASPAGVKPLQSRVQPWMMACFGPEISADKLERSDRFIEEALELVQSGDYPKERVLALVDYVYGRDKGEMPQEVGGVMITLAAFCLAHDIDMHEAGETELARIWAKVEKIRAKQAAKPTGSALPVAIEPAGVGVETQKVKDAFNHGYVLACCTVANLHDEPGIAFDVLQELGITAKAVEAMGLCEYDAAGLRKIEEARSSSVYRAALTKEATHD